VLASFDRGEHFEHRLRQTRPGALLGAPVRKPVRGARSSLAGRDAIGVFER
jgi:hypothetical protein